MLGIIGFRDSILWVNTPRYLFQYDISSSTDSTSVVLQNGAPYSEAIVTRMDEIINNGVGYSDALGHIALPLIIALCAFTFPFVFSIINDINNKYQSKIISKLFESSWPYRLFLGSVVFSLAYLIALGLFTVGSSKETIIEWKDFLNWATLIETVFFAAIVVRFVFYCIKFNQGKGVSEIVMKREKRDRLIAHWKVRRAKVKSWRKTIFDSKNKVKTDFYKTGVRQVIVWSNYGVDELYSNRLKEITKYAIRTQDISALKAALEGMNRIFEQEKNRVNRNYGLNSGGIEEGESHQMTMNFFGDVLPFLAANTWNGDVVDMFLWRMMGAFKRCNYIGYSDVYWMFICLRKVIDAGGDRIMEKYIDRSRYWFGSISRLPIVSYIKGVSKQEEREKMLKDASENWNRLCNYHFMIIAYAYNKGHRHLLKEMLREKVYSGKSLYPTTQCDILWRYHDCKKMVRKSGVEFGTDNIDRLFGKRLDVNNIIDEFVVAAMRETEQLGNIEMVETPKSLEDELNAYRNGLVKRTDKDFEGVFDRAVKTLVNQNNPFYNADMTWKEKAKKLLERLICGKQKVDIYSASIDKELKNRFLSLQSNSEDVLARRMTHNLYGEDSGRKTDTINLGEFRFQVNKLFLVVPDFFESWYRGVLHEIDEVVACRMMYATVTALHQMDVKEKRLPVPKLPSLLDNVVGKHPEEFVLISFDSHMDVFLHPDGKYGDYSFHGMPYIDIHTISYGDLNDLDYWTEFEHCLVIMRKNDLPCIGKESSKIAPWADFRDMSDETKGSLLVEICVNPNKVVRYNRDAEIIKVVTVPEKL